MPEHYRTVFNGGALVRRKIIIKANKAVTAPSLEPTLPEAEASKAVTVTQKALRAKLSAELFRSL